MHRRSLLLSALVGLLLLALWFAARPRSETAAAPRAPAAAEPPPAARALTLDPALDSVLDPGAAAEAAPAAPVQRLAAPADAALAPSTPDAELCRLTGRLVDEHGRALEGLPVVVFSQGPWPEAKAAQPLSPLSKLPGFKTRTDAAGRFRFEFPPPAVIATLNAGEDPLRERLVVLFSGPPGPIPSRSISRPKLQPGDVDLGDFVLGTASSIVGRVLTESGDPLAGALITLTSSGFSFDPPRVRSGPDGAFVLGGLTEPRAALEVVADGWQSASVEPFDLTLGRTHGPLEVRLEPGRRVAGRVLAADGRPLAGAKLQFLPLEGGRYAFDEHGVSAESDSEGRFEAILKKSAPHRVCGSLPGYLPLGSEQELEIHPGATLDITLESLPGTVFLVTDRFSGAPIERFLLEVHSPGAFVPGPRARELGAAADLPLHPGGRIEVPATPAEWVLVQAPGYAPFEGPVAWIGAQERTCRVQLAPLARLRGQAWLAGVGAAGARWELRDLARGPLCTGNTDSEGRFVIAGLGPGVFALKLSAAGAVLLREGIEIQGGMDLDLGALDLASAGSLSVRLLPPAGRSAGGLPVQLKQGHPAAALTSDAQGQVLFTGLAPGSYQVCFDGLPQHFDAAQPLEVQVEPGGVAQAQIDLAPLALSRIEVQFTGLRLDGAPVKLGLFDLDATPSSRWQLIAPSPPDSQGLWVGYGAPKGRATLLAQVDSAPSWHWPGAVLEPARGDRVQARFDLPAAELLLQWESAQDWPSDLSLSLWLEVLDSRARGGPGEDSQFSASVSFDGNRPGRLHGAAAELLGPGRLRWSALPPGRFQARLELHAAEGLPPLRRIETELILPQDGSAELRLR